MNNITLYDKKRYTVNVIRMVIRQGKYYSLFIFHSSLNKKRNIYV